MMKVYDYKGFPNPARIRIALAEASLLEVPSDLMRLTAWRARVAERPSVAHA